MNNPLVEYSGTDSSLGFLYQFEMGLLFLLDRPNSSISIETIDDLSFERNNVTNEIIQVKHRVKSKGNLNNASIDLWKTLNIWIDGINNKMFEEGKVSRILFTTQTAANNTIAYFLNRDEQIRNKSEALRLLINTAKNSTNHENKKIYKKFLKLSENEKDNLLNSIFIMSGSNDFISVRDQLIEKFRLISRPNNLKPFFVRVWGTWVNMVTELLISEERKTIRYGELISHIQDIREQFTQDNLPIDFINNEPSESEILSFNDDVFVQQLELVAANRPVIQQAIIDYWKAYQQRTRWINEELLFDKELVVYETRLFNAWKKEFAKMQRNLGEKPVENKKIELGWQLFDWADTKTDLCIRDRCTEPYVIQGSFHMLARELRIGWHVDFCEKLKSLVKSSPGVIR